MTETHRPWTLTVDVGGLVRLAVDLLDAAGLAEPVPLARVGGPGRPGLLGSSRVCR